MPKQSFHVTALSVNSELEMACPSKKSFLLRIDHAVHDALQRWADDDMRSLNAHIEYLLRESLKKAGRKPAKKPVGDRNHALDDQPSES